MRRTHGGPRLLQLLAVVLGVALLACLSLLVYRANQNSKAAERDAQFLLTTESDAANLVFSQREAGNLALKANAWLAGNATRRDVQVARALLARRLAVVGENGPNPAAWSSSSSTPPPTRSWAATSPAPRAGTWSTRRLSR